MAPSDDAAERNSSTILARFIMYIHKQHHQSNSSSRKIPVVNKRRCRWGGGTDPS